MESRIRDWTLFVLLVFGSFGARSFLPSLWLISPTGERVPLIEIAELVDGSSYSTIRRVDWDRTVSVTAAIAAIKVHAS